ncbi:MAG TPA: zinc ABC transporter substrate-binding protein, partial [Candidatus Kapabacteria bacterium]|nr:zinc ABC transporter substrate-binding protein [Candidatus Kapabacteria bacterium]
SGAKAIFNEPQLSDKAVRSIADEANVSVYLLDPVGGTSGRESYQELILYNARTLAKALAGD